MAAHESTFDQYFYVDETDDFKFTKTICSLSPKKVIFNDPATIVYWPDGSKTVVKCSNGDIYDREKGFAMCILKRLYGNKFHAMLKKHVLQEDSQKENNLITFKYDHVNARKIKQAVFEIIFENYDDAERVLEELVNSIKMCGFASVHYLHDLVDIKSTYSDMKWGWCDLTIASVKHTSDGYVLDLPRPVKRI